MRPPEAGSIRRSPIEGLSPGRPFLADEPQDLCHFGPGRAARPRCRPGDGFPACAGRVRCCSSAGWVDGNPADRAPRENPHYVARVHIGRGAFGDCASAAWESPWLWPAGAAGADEGFTPVRIVDTLKILGAAPAFPTGNYAVENMLRDPNATGPKLEYASHGQGLKTYVDFDLGSRTPVAGFRHVQRAGRDIVAAAELLFSDASAGFRPASGHGAGRARRRAGSDDDGHIRSEDRPVCALASQGDPARVPGERGRAVHRLLQGGPVAGRRPARSPSRSARLPVIARVDGRPMQRLAVSLQSPYGRPLDVVLRVSGMESRAIRLAWGENRQEYTIPAIDSERSVAVAVEFAGQTVASQVGRPAAHAQGDDLHPASTRTPISAIRSCKPRSKTSRSTTCCWAWSTPSARPAIRPAPGVRVERRGAVGGRSLLAASGRAATGQVPRGREERPGWAGRNVSQRADGPVPPGRIDAVVPLRHPVATADGRDDRHGDDQRRAGLHLGHRHRDAPGGHQVLFRGAELLRSHRRHPGPVGEQAVLLGRSFGRRQGAGMDSLQGLRHVARPPRTDARVPSSTT